MIRSNIQNIIGTGTGGTIDEVIFRIPFPCRLVAIEALNNTTATSTCKVSLRQTGTEMTMSLAPSRMNQAYWNGAAETLYNAEARFCRTSNLDMNVDGSFEIVAYFYNTVASDVLLLKVMYEMDVH